MADTDAAEAQRIEEIRQIGDDEIERLVNIMQTSDNEEHVVQALMGVHSHDGLVSHDYLVNSILRNPNIHRQSTIEMLRHDIHYLNFVLSALERGNRVSFPDVMEYLDRIRWGKGPSAATGGSGSSLWPGTADLP